MRDDVARAIENGITVRRRLLHTLSSNQQTLLLERLFLEFFGEQHILLQKWAALTGQTAQIDTGYIAQFIASLVLREPGQGFRGKGDDLADGSEVKSAANISGVDRPRWNHNLGKPAEDADRIRRGLLPVWQVYLNSPKLVYVLVDRVVGEERPAPVRVRCWCVNGRDDTAWRTLVEKFVVQRKPSQYNLQLHPPVGYDDNIVVNTLGNLDFRDCLVFDARIYTDLNDASRRVEWRRPVIEIDEFACAVAQSYGGRGDRPSRLTGADDIVADVAAVPKLFPGVFSVAEERQMLQVTTSEARTD